MGSFKLPDSFWKKVDRNGGSQDCWEWKGCKHKDGYGWFSLERKRLLTHRLVMSSFGFAVDALVVRHLCDNPSCVNIFHLAVGTHADNMRDMVERGRSYDQRGSKQHNAKLTEDDVMRIRELYSELPRSPSGRVKKGSLNRIASYYEVSFRTLENIVHRRRWKHI